MRSTRTVNRAACGLGSATRTSLLLRGFFAVVFWLFAAVPGCGESSSMSAEPEPTGDGLAIVATTGMVADVVRAVVGDRGTVRTLMTPGIDPHLYKPTRGDISAIMDADAVFYNGLLLEGKMTDTLIRAATTGKPVFAVTELVPEGELIAPEGGEGHADPHLWMDPVLWSQTIGLVRDRLAGLDPEGTAEFAANADAYLEELNGLNEYAARVAATVPESSRVLITAHDAFNYFGRRFGYEVVGIQGISTESEAGVRDIERLVSLLVERRVAAVFVESTVSDRNIRALIGGAEARGHAVVIGGELFSDAMGEDGTYRGTYLGMIDHNVTTIVRALGGTAPEDGWRGRLSE